MGTFLAELKRRQMFRVAAAYVVVAWVLLQLINNLADALKLPDWVPATVVVLLALGFPVALLFAWIQHMASADATAHEARANRLDWTLVGGIAAVIAIFLFQQFAFGPTTGTQPQGVDAAKSAANSPAGAVSIAVLPFENLSGDAAQEFFSDGMTEEITTALAKISDLRVVGRTSASQFKGEKKDLRAIGQALSATHLIEGSVRRAGDRVRITAQLIRADDGSHIWAESYDRTLTDIFAIQEDIGRAITASLRMPLGLKPGENLVNNRSIDPESYEKYLRAIALLHARNLNARNRTEAVALLEQVVARNPNYAPALAVLSEGYFVTANPHGANLNESVAESRAVAGELREKGEAAARRAIQSDSNYGMGYNQLAVLIWSRGKPVEADELFTKALALDALNTDILLGYGGRLGIAGRLKEALALGEKGLAVDPFYPNVIAGTARDRWLNGRNDDAIALAKTLNPDDRAPVLSLIYASMGRYGEAADALMEIAVDPKSDVAQAERLLRTAPAKTASPETLPRLPPQLEFVYVHVGAPERALASYERRAEVGFLGGAYSYVWHPFYASVRKTERFKTLMRKVGLVEYWRAKGWPEQCHPTAGDDFECS